MRSRTTASTAFFTLRKIQLNLFDKTQLTSSLGFDQCLLTLMLHIFLLMAIISLVDTEIARLQNHALLLQFCSVRRQKTPSSQIPKRCFKITTMGCFSKIFEGIKPLEPRKVWLFQSLSEIRIFHSPPENTRHSTLLYKFGKMSSLVNIHSIPGPFSENIAHD